MKRGDLDPTASGWLSITRRAFLGSSSATALLLPASANGQEEAPAFEQDGRDLILRWVSGGAAKFWRIDADWVVAEADSTHGRLVRRRSSTRATVSGRYAGTNIPANFQIDISQRTGVWGLGWRYEGKQLDWVSLTDWFNGASVPITCSRLAEVEPRNSALELRDTPLVGRLRWPLSVELSSPGVRFKLGSTSGSAKTVAVAVFDEPGAAGPNPNPRLAENISKLLTDTAPKAELKVRASLTFVTLDDVADGWALGFVSGVGLRLLPDQPIIHADIVKDRAADRFYVAWRWICAAGRLIVGDRRDPRTILVEQAEFVQVVDWRRGLSMRLPLTPQMIETEEFSAVVIGGVGEEFFPEFNRQPGIALPIELIGVHARGTDSARYDVDFRVRRVDNMGLDRSAILWRETEVGGAIADLVIGIPGADNGGRQASMISLGRASGLDVTLNFPGALALDRDGPVLRVRRHEDALDIGFQFHDYRLKIGREGALIVPGPAAQRAVRFHPQHLQEEVFQDPIALLEKVRAAAAGLLTGAATAKSPARELGKSAPYGTGGEQTLLARTRASGPSWIVFKPDAAAPGLPLTVAALTDWRNLALAAPARAEWANLPLDDQLTRLGITPAMDQAAARGRVIDSLKEPGPTVTALELVTGLQFAPDGRARFRVPRRRPSETGPLWTAQLELMPVPVAEGALAEPARVRAVWSTGFDPRAILDTTCGVNASLGDDAPFETSVNARDRGEVMLLSSGLGLGALRAVTLSGQDVPYSLVRRPKATFSYISNKPETPPPTPGGPPPDPDAPGVAQEGVMLPAPFTRFNARLTGYGADLDALWQGEPAAPYSKAPFFNRAFSVEKYVHRTSLGADMFVEVVYKGFLLPYGFRVSLVKITEREGREISGMGAMMPAIQRFFILPKPVEKTFPGIYQPYAGLDIPVRHARLINGISPELDQSRMEPPDDLSALLPKEPKAVSNGCSGEAGAERKPAGRVFWPCKRIDGSVIQFDFEADDTGVRRSVPLLFVDNAAVHHPPTIRAIMDYYNNLAPINLRTERHHGGRTIFAPPAKAGDTSFETDHIILRARSRTIEVPPPPAPRPAAPPAPSEADIDAAFHMDAFMEGADEPPLYPVMVEASIRIPPLDRLVGEPQGLKRVGYVPHYVRNGFNVKANPGELYLGFLDRGGVMDLSARGEKSGGVAQTPTPLAGISRANAIVGAEPVRKPPDRAVADAAPAVKADAWMPPPVGADIPFDFKPALEDRFEPASFLPDGKLLGILKFRDVVMAATMAAQPKLTEVYEYAVASAEGGAAAVLKVLQEACRLAAKAIEAALDKADAALFDFLSSENAGFKPVKPTAADRHPNLDRFYPDLSGDLEALKAVLIGASTTDLSRLPEHASALSERWRRLRGTVDAVIANPTPEPIRGIISQVRQLIDALENGLLGALQEAVRKAIDAFVTTQVEPWVRAALDACFDAAGKLVNEWMFDALFGPLRPPLPPETTIAKPPTRADLQKLVDALLAHPEVISQATLTAPLADALTLPLLRLIGDARRLVDTIAAGERKAIERIANLARELLERVLGALASIQSLVAAASAEAAALCAGAAAPIVEIATLATDALPSAAQVNSAFSFIRAQLPLLDLPGADPTPEVRAAREAAAALRLAIQNVGANIAAVQKKGAEFKDLAQWCSTPGRIPTAIAELARLRLATLASVKDCVDQLRLVESALLLISADLWADARSAVKSIRREFIILAVRLTLARLTAARIGGTELGQRLDKLGKRARARVNEAAAQVLAIGSDLDARLSSVSKLRLDHISDELGAGIVATATELAAIERRLLATATDLTALEGAVLDSVKPMVAQLAGAVCAPLLNVHKLVADQATAAVALLETGPDLLLMLTGPLLERLRLARDAVVRDQAALARIPTYPQEASVLLTRWSNEEPGLVAATRTVAELFEAVARGQIGALFDLAEVRRAVEDAVRRLIPSRVTMRYVWTASLKPFPPADPVFLPNTKADGEPSTDGKSADLSIDTEIQIDLLNPKDRKVTVKGSVRPFAIQLLGKATDLITIGLKDTEFTVLPGQSPRFSTTIDDVQIGTQLKFLEAIMELVGGKGGFAIRPSFSPPGVLIGYSFAAPILSVGALTVLDVALEIAVLLPFDGSPAQFRFAFASRNRPFGIIIAPCYYGGGFVALTAAADRILAFEIMLEFGAATAIKFGPLDGRGKVSTGIYLFLRSDGTQRLEGFVHAVGEGQIACFGISVNLEVKIVSDGSSMKGSATFTFTFKVGFAEFDYSVPALYSFKGGGASGEVPQFPRDDSYEIDAPDKRREWREYRSHFTPSWPVA
ncbi:hypothetical protein [Sphingobium fuliginis]|uniref:Uncharacterized protein n=1 Tax=Sphingobium fuliginis (strain ATCC 27551) TaxID=336203 RepID=A0ABQ1ET79_SPHSA|nr:hypothetical protein [Sphingobium fuliginis]RYL99637.1 hypothetical protein EWH10_07205 [Sphingobium fuliginis]GFZ86170.1 hypothetical protein GCM10019071_14430 [Sphingobium fuliginis]